MKVDSDVQTAVFACRGLKLCRFRCPADHERWRRENRIQDGHNIAFPELPVEIRKAGGPTILADSNIAVFYNHGEPFHRGRRHPSGDAGNIFLFDSEILLQALSIHDPEADPERPLSIGFGPVPARTFLKQRLLLATADRQPQVDPDWVFEQALEILDEVLTAGYQTRRRQRPPIESQRQRVEAVKDRIARSWHQQLSLAQLAKEVDTSVFHLCRNFKRHTGATIHGYRQRLRLRAGLVRLERTERSLAELALEVGFSHQSHFTEAFRRAFDAPPGQIRALLRKGWVNGDR